MDPNETLKRMLKLCRDFESYGWIAPDEGQELVELFGAMHEWFMKGGFLPALWADKVAGGRFAPPNYTDHSSDDPWLNTETLAKGEPPF